MKLKSICGLILLFALIASYPACKKDCKAGKGGNVTLILKPQHHGNPILSKGVYPDSAFIKFNATDFPGPNPSSYDMVLVGDSGSDQVSVPGLSCGQYYITMTGYDSAYAKRVAGGVPLDFDQTSGSKTLAVPISE